MSLYERDRAARKTRRWDADVGVWRDCPYDEPETRQRKPGEGMVVFPPRYGEVIEGPFAYFVAGPTELAKLKATTGA